MYGTLKGFVGDGSERVPAVRSFLGFVDFDDRFFRLFDAFGSFSRSTKPFWRVPEKTFF